MLLIQFYQNETEYFLRWSRFWRAMLRGELGLHEVGVEGSWKQKKFEIDFHLQTFQFLDLSNYTFELTGETNSGKFLLRVSSKKHEQSKILLLLMFSKPLPILEPVLNAISISIPRISELIQWKIDHMKDASSHLWNVFNHVLQSLTIIPFAMKSIHHTMQSAVQSNWTNVFWTHFLTSLIIANSVASWICVHGPVFLGRSNLELYHLWFTIK